MDKENKKQGRKCFIITPIGSPDSDIFRQISGVIDSVIRPVLQKNGFIDVKAAHEISEPGSINTQIINRIVEDDLVVANLTTNNPNVMYELCLRHVTAKPIIHICEKGTTLPFDIKDSRTIFYTNDMYGVFELAEKVEKCLKQIDFDKEYRDNPIYNAMTISNLLKPSEGSGENKQMLMLQQILEKVAYKDPLPSSVSTEVARYFVKLQTKAAVDSLKKFLLQTELREDYQIGINEEKCEVNIGLSNEKEINEIVNFLEERKLGYKVIKCF